MILIVAVVLSAGSCARNVGVVSSPETTKEPAQTESVNVCTFTIECSTVFDNADLLNGAVVPYIPEDGFILREREVSFEEGESVADVLRRVCDENSIPLETSGVPGSGSLYIEGIGHLYEFDCGSGSGWMYRVNGEYPNFGADAFILKAGDKVEWKYTCDFGADIGGEDH